MYSRRDFGRLALASLPLSAAWGNVNSKVAGVQLGVCTYSFRDLPRTGPDDVDTVTQALTNCRAGQCELFSPQVEPGSSPSSERLLPEERSKHREALRQWRLATPMSHFKEIRRRFDSAGIDIYAYTLNFDHSFTDEELGKCFEQTKALGVKTIASSTEVSMLPRLQPLAEKHKIYVAVHGHSDVKHPDQFSSPETFQKALEMSNWFRVNLDIGHFSAAGFDPVAYINEHHDRITHLHVKDRRKSDGPNEPFGRGDTPIQQVLQLLKDKKFPIPAFVEYEYEGTGTPVEEVRKCLAYMRAALA